jgi:hypothetical protein
MTQAVNILLFNDSISVYVTKLISLSVFATSAAPLWKRLLCRQSDNGAVNHCLVRLLFRQNEAVRQISFVKNRGTCVTERHRILFWRSQGRRNKTNLRSNEEVVPL